MERKTQLMPGRMPFPEEITKNRGYPVPPKGEIQNMEQTEKEGKGKKRFGRTDNHTESARGVKGEAQGR